MSSFRSRVSLIFVPNRSAGALDAFLPLYVHLAKTRSDMIFDVVVLDPDAYATIESSPFYLGVFTCFGRLHLPARNWPERLSLRTIAKLLYLVGLLLFRRMVCRKVISLGNSNLATWRSRALSWLLSALSDHYTYPGSSGVATVDLRRLETDEAHAWLFEQGMKRSMVAHSPKKALCYLESEIEANRLSRFFKGTEFTPIGYPRLFSSWPTGIAPIAEPIFADEMRRLALPTTTRSVISIILTDPNYPWFKTPNRYREMLVDVIRLIRARFPDVPILMKAKPTHAATFTSWLNEDDFDGLYLSFCPLPVLAMRTVVALTINESSGVFEFALAGVPVIEYSDYSDEWLAQHPQGSVYRGLPGLAFAENEAFLSDFLDRVTSNKFPVAEQKTLAQFFGHRENLDVFLPSAHVRGSGGRLSADSRSNLTA